MRARPIPEIYEQVSPVVVTITAQSINPFRLQDRVNQSLGSGFIIQNDGLILTSSHVVYGKQSLTVTLDDGSTVPARIVGADPIFDIALIRIAKPAKGTLPVLKLGDSPARVGETSSPRHARPSIRLSRAGSSGLNRLPPDTVFSPEPLIQTDADQPGNWRPVAQPLRAR
jgi:S1-C subfamily serine protease